MSTHKLVSIHKRSSSKPERKQQEQAVCDFAQQYQSVLCRVFGVPETQIEMLVNSQEINRLDWTLDSDTVGLILVWGVENIVITNLLELASIPEFSNKIYLGDDVVGLYISV